MELDPIKLLKCLVCGRDVPVNARYPIAEVTCQPCYRQKNDKNV
jgi:hypothetical protein